MTTVLPDAGVRFPQADTALPAPVEPSAARASGAAARPRPGLPSAALGLVTAGLGLAAAMLVHRVVPQVGVLTWAVGLGVAGTNLRLVPAHALTALAGMTRRLLRIGIVLLGFSVSFASIAALGLPVIALVAGCLVSTLVFGNWLGGRWGLSKPRRLLLATGVAICGASAIAAMEETAQADEEDVTASIAMVTLFGTLALVLLPLLQHVLGLSGMQFGAWTGASVHEVGQVVAAASPAGSAVVATAVVVKLTRVTMLAPVVAVVSVVQRLKTPGDAPQAARTPLLPLFVLGFLACAALRTTGVVPTVALNWIGQAQVIALGAALFGMGAAVRISSLMKKSGPLLAVGAVTTLFLSGLSLAGILLLIHT